MGSCLAVHPISYTARTQGPSAVYNMVLLGLGPGYSSLDVCITPTDDPLLRFAVLIGDTA